MMYGATIRATAAGRIRDVHFEDGPRWSDFVIVTAKDIPGENCLPSELHDQPVLAAEFVKHAEEPVLLLAHSDPYLLEEARWKVRVEVDPVIASEPTVFHTIRINEGDIDEGFAAADFIVEGEYETGAQEHLYLETNGVIARANPEDGVTIWGSMESLYHVHKAMQRIFIQSPQKIRVIQMETGGGFGGKDEYPAMIAAHAALLAWKSASPVKMIYDRAEDMAATPKRHPSRVTHRTGVTRDGKLVAMEIGVDLDSGAYGTVSPETLAQAVRHATGVYSCPAVRIRGTANATPLPPNGSFRGSGAAQAIFAIELHMQKVAATTGLSAEEIRRRNFASGEDAASSGQRLLNMALDHAKYYDRVAEFERANESAHIKRGIGFAAFLSSAAPGEESEPAQAIIGVEATNEGNVRILTSLTESGEGIHTILAQIAADALGVNYNRVEIAQPDTAAVPDSGSAAELVRSACVSLKDQLIARGLLKEIYTDAQFARAAADAVEQFRSFRVFSDSAPSKRERAQETTWAVCVAAVAIDLMTYEIRVDDIVLALETGPLIHPSIATAQVESAVAQAIGYSLLERVDWEDGRVVNASLRRYLIPGAADLPPIRIIFEENSGTPRDEFATANDPGEVTICGVAPAILNAVEQALGVGIDSIPLTPENLMERIAT